MKTKLILLLVLLMGISLNLNANRFWQQNKSMFNVESIISYSPSVVNYVYGDLNHWDIKRNWQDIRANNDYGYCFSDAVQWHHLFNVYPFFQGGFNLNYRFSWGLKTFVLSNTYRLVGFNFDVYSLSFQLSLLDLGFSYFKYNWNNWNSHENNEWCLLISPLTTGLSYRVSIHKNVDILINIGYSLQIIVDNDTYVNDKELSMFLEHSFNSGIGFRFKIKDFE